MALSCCAALKSPGPVASNCGCVQVALRSSVENPPNAKGNQVRALKRLVQPGRVFKRAGSMIVSCRISSLALLVAVLMPVAARQTASTAYQTAIPHMLFQRTQPVLPVCRSAGASSTLTTARRNVAASANCAREHSRLWLAQLAASQHDTQKKNSGGGRVKAPCILLNEDIVAAAAQSRDCKLCALVEDRWLEFNAVNAATAYGKLLLITTSRDTATARQSGMYLCSRVVL